MAPVGLGHFAHYDAGAVIAAAMKDVDSQPV